MSKAFATYNCPNFRWFVFRFHLFFVYTCWFAANFISIRYLLPAINQRRMALEQSKLDILQTCPGQNEDCCNEYPVFFTLATVFDEFGKQRAVLCNV